jgi:hypothetical protein
VWWRGGIDVRAVRMDCEAYLTICITLHKTVFLVFHARSIDGPRSEVKIRADLYIDSLRLYLSRGIVRPYDYCEQNVFFLAAAYWYRENTQQAHEQGSSLFTAIFAFEWHSHINQSVHSPPSFSSISQPTSLHTCPWYHSGTFSSLILGAGGARPMLTGFVSMSLKSSLT